MALCGACADFGETQPPLSTIDAEHMQFPFSSLQSEQPTKSWPQPQWWRDFGDARLDALIENALTGNLDISAAAARVRAAQQIELALNAQTDPRVAFNAVIERDRYSENFLYTDRLTRTPHTESRLTFDFSYEFDFWGRQRAIVSAARQRVEAARAEQEAVRLIVALAVARSYLQLQGALAGQALADEYTRQLDEIVRLNRLRERRGLFSQASLELDSARLANARHAAQTSSYYIESLRHQLAALSGEGPGALSDLTVPRWRDARLSLPNVVPVDLLGRRPDIQARRLEVAAKSSDVAQIRAEFYPNIDIGGFIGFESIGISDWLRGESRTFSIGPALHLPLFNRAALRGRLGLRQSELDVAISAYNQSVLDALREAADQISALRTLARQHGEADSALESLQKARALCALRYARGLATRRELLDAEIAVNAQQRARNDQWQNEWLAALNLIRVLGGGYTAKERAEHG